MSSRAMWAYIGLVALIATSYVYFTRIPDDSAPVPAPDLALPLHKGAAPVHLRDMRGQVVLIDFWATWCGPCRLSIPEIEHLYEKYRDHGLRVIGISTDEEDTRAEIPRAIKDMGMTYPVVLGSDIYDMRSKYIFDSIPLLIVIDKQGKIRERQNGYDPHFDLEETVVKLLKEK